MKSPFKFWLFILVIIGVIASDAVMRSKKSKAARNTSSLSANLEPGKVFYFRVMWNDDAATTATIGWSSELEPKNQKVYYDTVDHGMDVANYASSQTVDFSNQSFEMHNAFVHLKNLKSKTRYYFVVSNTEGSRRLWFETSPDSPDERLSIIAGGDSRNNRKPRCNANRLVARLRPHVVVFGGDMTDGGTVNEWREWMEDWQLTFADDGRVTPLIIARGNHESRDDILINLFATPKGVYYGVNLGGSLARVYTLNTESSIAGDQTDWLKSDLAANASMVKWTLAQYHKPIRPHTKTKPEGDKQYTYWAGLFHEYGMDLVVECDTHTVKTTWPLRPSTEPGNDSGFVRDDATGTVFIGEGCWGAPLKPNDDNKSWTRDSGRFNHFSWIFMDQKQIEIRTVKVDNMDNVESLSDTTRFSIPADLDIWKPTNGEVITIAAQ